MDRGINELFEGPTITYGSHKYVLPPSSFAEAEIGLMTPGQIKRGLEEVLDLLTQNNTIEADAIRRVLKRKGTIVLEDLVEKVKAHHEGTAKLITGKPVKQMNMSGGGIWYFEIRRRGKSTKERDRKGTVGLDSEGNIAQYACPCETYRYNLFKGNYDKLSEETNKNGARQAAANAQLLDVSGFPSFVTHVACYHVAAALTDISRTTGTYELLFKFIELAVFEALFMDVFRNIKEATIDDYLIRQGALTQETIGRISEGKLTLEVVKHMKNIDSRTQTIIGKIRLARERDGYTFSGFATDFRGTPYQTTSIILTKSDGRSVHILYDSRLRVSVQRVTPTNLKLETGLPLIMLNIPIFVWMNEGRSPVAPEYSGDPVAIAGPPFRGFDERTGQEVVSIIARPDRQFITTEEFSAYNRVFTERRLKEQPMLN